MTVQTPQGAPALVLASGSPVRKRLLTDAGYDFSTDPADVDETALIERERTAGRAIRAIAGVLADEKARIVSKRSAVESLVIGSDQILEVGGAILQKPQSIEEVEERIALLQGRTHTLYCAVSVARGGSILWRHTQRADLTMRALDPDAVSRYVARHGRDVMNSVGAYHLEGSGVHLFDRLDGDYFAILGLPMVPLIARLRRLGIVLP